MIALYVTLGAAIGAPARFLIDQYFRKFTSKPIGTFTVNILGSLLIGIILGLAAKNNTLNQDQTLLLATGFCGGFTTFSAFAYENQALFKNGDFTSFAVYTISSFVVAFLAVFAGLYVSRILA